jgi:hypothetical protein
VNYYYATGCWAQYINILNSVITIIFERERERALWQEKNTIFELRKTTRSQKKNVVLLLLLLWLLLYFKSNGDIIIIIQGSIASHLFLSPRGLSQGDRPKQSIQRVVYQYAYLPAMGSWHISMLIWPVSAYANSISAGGTAVSDTLMVASSLCAMVTWTSFFFPLFHIAFKLIIWYRLLPPDG